MNWEILNKEKNLTAFEKILKNRGFALSDLENENTHDPYLFTDMARAVEKIKTAIKNKDRIMIFGDYDADGITGTAILFRILSNLGAQVSYRIPHREHDGYGLSEKFVDEFIKLDIKLLITVDCGISSGKEVGKALNNGIETIITDHHEIPKKTPDVYAIIHPKLEEKYPYKDLSGAGVALKLAQALQNDPLENYFDLAAIGTIADVMPLTGENRAIARKGLRQMSETSWSGLAALIKVSDVKKEDLINMESATVGYRLAPRLNAAGRISDPYISIKLLTTDDLAKTQEISQKLNDLNLERQASIKEILENIKYNADSDIIFAEGKWPKGLLGLIAGRISEKENRPVLAMSKSDGVVTGSARSPKYFDITAGLTRQHRFLKHYGGHKKAAGFSLQVDNLDSFKNAFLSDASKIEIEDKKIEVDCELDPKENLNELVSNLGKLRPFGEGNYEPKVLLRKLTIIESKKVGGEKHLKLRCKFGGKELSFIKFNNNLNVEKGDKIDTVCRINGGGDSLVVEDLKTL
ncbi:MAG: exonuclease RecJ, single-stranded-DNA-specific exonuclease [Candidatus Peregrinibacteria bacterium GW2011_GWF2_43_17]|nr:MAG: exonuclease RecJ, single-stranded-DNA-specific exonuclease [Candidatus Peregrinibacteria bacterium GW2011_GWF2_43_17]